MPKTRIIFQFSLEWDVPQQDELQTGRRSS